MNEGLRRCLGYRGAVGSDFLFGGEYGDLMIRLCILFSALLCALCFALPMPSALAQDSWSEPFEGVRYLQRTTAEPNRIHALVVDMCAVGVSAQITRAEDKGLRTSQFATRYGVQVAINGGFYNTANYAAIGLTMGDGQRWPGTGDDATWGFIAFGRDNQVEISPPAEVVSTVPDWMQQIVSGRPLLVDAGELVVAPCDSHFCERHPRTAVGIDRSGRTLIKVVVDGRWTGVSRGMNRTELGRLMIDLGAHRAINLDGGGSSTMFIEGQGVVNRPSDGSERVVSNHLGLRAGGATDYARCCIPRAVDGATGVFADIPDDHWARQVAEILFEAGITTGCSQEPRMFCPGCDLSRAQGAVLLARALGISPLPGAQSTFEDLSPGDFGAGYIEALSDAGLISGCSASPRRFCPEQGLTRGQASVLILRAMGVTAQAVQTPTFEDTPVDAFYTPSVEMLHKACVVSGCSQEPSLFCPDHVVTRAQFAALLVRGLELGGVRNCLESLLPHPGEDVGPPELVDAGDVPVDSGDLPDLHGEDVREATDTHDPSREDPSAGTEAELGSPSDPSHSGQGTVISRGCACQTVSSKGFTPPLIFFLMLLGLIPRVRRLPWV